VTSSLGIKPQIRHASVFVRSQNKLNVLSLCQVVHNLFNLIKIYQTQEIFNVEGYDDNDNGDEDNN
jgi:hypothetical protein